MMREQLDISVSELLFGFIMFFILAFIIGWIVCIFWFCDSIPQCSYSQESQQLMEKLDSIESRLP